MKIYDISQELLSSQVYEGDPTPTARLVRSMDRGESYNLTVLSLCVHNGTHVDAPRHFISDGADVSHVPLESCVGYAYVTTQKGNIDSALATEIIRLAQALHPDSARRILVKGDAVLTAEGAKSFVNGGVLLVGTESQSVGQPESPMEVHLILLSEGVVLLEGIRLADVSDGVYLLAAQPISIDGSDGAPVRAILIDKS